ncbi:MAG: hypothetical protein ACI376_03985 [Candidatus Bruticola sp.]
MDNQPTETAKSTASHINLEIPCSQMCDGSVSTVKNDYQKVSELSDNRCAPLACPNECSSTLCEKIRKQVKQWPLQLKMVPVQADFFEDAKLLLAADCTAYSCAYFHQKFVHGRTVLIGCPELDGTDYSQKITEILQKNNIRSLMIVRMDVPCCAVLEQSAINALNSSGKFIPWQIIKLPTDS